MKTIEISRKETSHDIATEYATVFDNGLVSLRRKVRSKLTPAPGRSTDEADNPNNTLTIEQIKKLAAAL